MKIFKKLMMRKLSEELIYIDNTYTNIGLTPLDNTETLIKVTVIL